MKNVDAYYNERKRRKDNEDYNFERIKEAMESELAHRGYNLDQINALDNWLTEQATKCQRQLDDYEAIDPYEWIEDEDKAGQIENELLNQ